MDERRESDRVVFKFERAAMNEEPMPNGLSFSDQVIYIGLRYLYGSKRRGIITVDAAKAEKKKLIASVQQREKLLAFEKSCFEQSARLRKDIEAAASSYRLNPSIEAANRLISAIDGIKFTKGTAAHDT